MQPQLQDLTSQKHYRIIPSVYPPINFFEDCVTPELMEEAWLIESLTNERLRNEVGDLQLVNPEDRISGPGSSVVMAAFTHIGYPSRFSNGSFGVYYAAFNCETAIRETIYHRENFLRATLEEPGEICMRVYLGKIAKPLHDVRFEQYQHLYDPNDYSLPQTFGMDLRNDQSWGVIYHSVRHPGNDCIALFRPPATTIPMQTQHLFYVWDGSRISHVKESKIVLQL